MLSVLEITLFILLVVSIVVISYLVTKVLKLRANVLKLKNLVSQKEDDIGLLSEPRCQEGVLYSSLSPEYRNTVYWFRRKLVLRHASATLQDIIDSLNGGSSIIGWHTYFVHLTLTIKTPKGVSLSIDDPYGEIETEPFHIDYEKVTKMRGRMVIVTLLVDNGKIFVDGIKSTHLMLDGTFVE